MQAQEQTASPTPIRAIWTRVEFEEALRRCIKASQRKDGDSVYRYLNRAACLFLGLEESMTSRATVQEASTEALVKELRKRARTEHDAIAAQALKIKPGNAEKARA